MDYGIKNNVDKSEFIYLKDEKNSKGNLGITDNRIVEIPNFVTPGVAKNMIAFFESRAQMWGDVAFYNSSGMGLAEGDPQLPDYGLPTDFFPELKKSFSKAVQTVFDREVKPNTSHAQKWVVGGFASPHSDNSDMDGNPNAFEINKYVGILYLNNDYEGGQLYFPEHDIEFKPNSYSYYVFCGGVENIHGVREITDGTRYTMVSFWDYADSAYDEDKLNSWDEELKMVRQQQEEQKDLWSKGIK